ncbi:MAG: AAA family ATPase [Candidatus Binatia bacterium]|nr:AAA family ATPase [Candidatus Binatia bacterium]
MSSLERLRRIRDELLQLFVERQAVIDGALTCLLARQHLLLVGPPGTAKSMLADEVCSRLEGARYFQWLLTRFSTPEEIFGAVSLSGLEQDEYRRVTTGKLPEAHIAFLDEVFKANSSILNALLAIMNERRFHNGREVANVPLVTLFGATNELPDDDELQALYDRFLVRFTVSYIQDDFHFLRMLEGRSPVQRTTLALAELVELQRSVADVQVPSSIFRSLADLRRELLRKQVVASDRRYRQAVSVLQAHALLRGATTVGEEDLFFLEHVLWRAPSEQAEVRATIRELLRGYEDEARALLFQGREIEEYAHRQWDNHELRSRAVVEAHTKLRQLLRKVGAIVDAARAAGRPTDTVEAVQREIEEIQKRMLETL